LLTGDPIAIEAGADGLILVLDRRESSASSAIRLYRDGVPLGAPAATADRRPPLKLDVRAHDFALVRATDPKDPAAIGTIFVADDSGNQSYAFGARVAGKRLHLELAHKYYPMRLFGGKGIVAGRGEAYYDFGDGWIPLVCQPRANYGQEAIVVTPVLDGDEPGCVWHRLLIDAVLPPGTALAVSTKAADEEDELALAGWQDEPEPVRRRGGPEVPFYEDQGPYDTYELLFQRAAGRFLRMRLQLTGDGRSTPRLRALRAYFPRFSYLERYLPGVYREEPESASFLDRYLANVEGFYTAIEERIAEAQVLLDSRTAPNDTLDWLAGWFDISLDPMWNEAKRRLLIRNAMHFFQLRGTIRGVELALRLAFESSVDQGAFDDPLAARLGRARIVESFRTRKTPGVVFGDPTDLGGPRIVTRLERWRPDQGREVLNDRYRGYLERTGLSVAATEFPTSDPGDASSDAWRQFSAAAVGFVPESPAGTEAAWRAFLARRYANVGELRRAYSGVSLTEFADAKPPTALPADGAPLLDWFQFNSVVQPMRKKAHRFTVLLPTNLPVADLRGRALEHDELRALTQRIVDLQKPAHTRFNVKFFWAAFRIGEARLGDDTLIETGSRVPELVTPSVLGREHLGETYLGGPAQRDEVRRPPLTETGQETP
jgi:phage tail-like protein